MKQKRKSRIGLKIVLGVLGLFLIAVFSVLLSWRFSVDNIRRLDEAGTLYSMDYVGDYDRPLLKLPIRFLKGGGCSAFAAHNTDGEMLTCRNYDLAHKDKDGNITGLNIVLRLTPRGKYRSVCVADGAWISSIGLPYYAGAPDEPLMPKFALAFLPYLCMDGMNEKGLTVSVLALDTPEGEKAVYQTEPGKPEAVITELLRYMLDDCATVAEAEQKASQYNMVNILNRDYHLFVTDADGNAAVFEWRYNTLTVTRTDIVTNFYVNSDDAADCYQGGQLKEAFPGAEAAHRGYRYGYGHGYGRFNTLAAGLKGFEKKSAVLRPAWSNAEMSETEAWKLLKAVSQTYTGALTSYTQYSAIYNSTDGTLVLRLPGSTAEYRFEIHQTKPE